MQLAYSKWNCNRHLSQFVFAINSPAPHRDGSSIFEPHLRESRFYPYILFSLSPWHSLFLFTPPCGVLCAVVLCILIFHTNTVLWVVTGCITFILPDPLPILSGKGSRRPWQNQHQNLTVHAKPKEIQEQPRRLNADEAEAKNADLEYITQPPIKRISSLIGFTIRPQPSHPGFEGHVKLRAKS